MSTISSKDLDQDDYLDASSRREQQPPQVVTVSAMDELQRTLCARDARIAFLEKELIDARLQLASSKASEDRLMLELDKMKETIAEATSNSPVQPFRPPVVGADETGVNHAASVRRSMRAMPVRRSRQLHVIRSSSTEPIEISPEVHPLVLPTALGSNNAFQLPLDQPIGKVTQGVTSQEPLVMSRPSFSRKRSNRDIPCPWQNLNPGSCASGLGLLAGDMPSGTSLSMGLNSTASINRMLGGFGLSSHHSFKKLRSGDLAAASGTRISENAGISRGGGGAAAGTYSRQRNEGWGDGIPETVMSAGPQNNMFASFTMTGARAASSSEDQRQNPLLARNLPSA